eukprot:TRINITY_DN8797_c0_g1_i1.p1 TRINITY_DN8797_c0_g1~~TRINITY_DN8797_c0_g1_i1.p1  ORF type:complete len:525 (-),score=32.85 TRINITY_DN8797_c0_g1_i1:13-1587(-)
MKISLADSNEDEVPLVTKISKSKKFLFLVTVLIIASEFCERTSFYSIEANLMLLFTQTLKMGNAEANMLALFWKGCCYLTPLIGAWVADNYWGRFKTIVVFTIFYVLSMTSLAIGVIPSVVQTQPWVVLFSIFVISVATGGIKPNVITYGADQFEFISDKTEKKESLQSYFHWFFFFNITGSVIAYTAVAYVQQEISVSLGFGIPAVIMFLSCVFFVSGYKLYDSVPIEGTGIIRNLSIVYHSIIAPANVKLLVNEDNGSFLDRAKHIEESPGKLKFSSQEVDDMKKFVRILPVMMTLIVYTCCNAQMSTVFYTQGTALNLRITDTFDLPIVSLNIFDTIGILVLVILFDRVIYPLLRKRDIHLSALQRMGFGYLFATLSIFYAGALEVYRKTLFVEGRVIEQTIGNTTVTAVDLSVLTQAPGFILMAGGAVLASIPGLEFANTQAPASMKSMCIAVYYLTGALGSYLGSALIGIVNAVTTPKWIGDPNWSHLDLYFFLLTVIGFVNYFVFLFIARFYKDKPKN